MDDAASRRIDMETRICYSIVALPVEWWGCLFLANWIWGRTGFDGDGETGGSEPWTPGPRKKPGTLNTNAKNENFALAA